MECCELPSKQVSYNSFLFWAVTQQMLDSFTDISSQPASPIFKGHTVQDP